MPSLRLYLQNAAAPYTPATIRGAWDTTTTGASALGTSKNGTVTDVSAIDNLQADHDRLLRRFCYVLVEDAYLAGSVQGAVGCYETSDDLNAHLHLHLFVLQGQSNDLRGTLWADYIDPDEAPSNTSLCGEGFSGTLTPLQAVAGDVLVLEVGYRSNNSSGTTRSGGIYYGGTGATDLTDGGDAAQYPGWVELEYSEPVQIPGAVGFAALRATTGHPWITSAGPDLLLYGSRGYYSAAETGADMLAIGSEGAWWAGWTGPFAIAGAVAFAALRGLAGAPAAGRYIAGAVGYGALRGLAGAARYGASIAGAIGHAALRGLAGVPGQQEIPPGPGEPTSRRTLKVFEPDGTLVGFLLADVKWATRLNGNNDIESISIPREYLLSSGISISKLQYLDDGWYVEWGGYRYVLENTEGDLEAGITAQAGDAAAADLANVYCSYSAGPATFLNQLPSRIAGAILSGKCGRAVRNPGFGILDSGGLPTNWTHPAGWTSQLVENRRVWQADAGSEESVSDDRPCTPGISYQVVLDMAAAGTTGTRGVKIRWIKADGSTVDSAVTNLATEDGAFHEVDTGPLVAQGNRMRIVLVTSGTGHTTQFDDVKLYEIGPDTGYVFDGDMDTRLAAVPFGDGAIQRYGVWAEGGGSPAEYLASSTAGDYIGRVFNGPFVTVHFKGAGAGNWAKVRINGVQYQQSGSSLVRGTANINVAGDLSLTCPGLDPTNDHIIEVEVASGTVRFAGLTVTTENLISMSYDVTTSVYEGLAGLQKAVGGEMWFDYSSANPVCYYRQQRGRDLKDNNVIDFRRGKNITKMTLRKDRTKIVNRLTGLGYGEGEYQLVVTVDATGVHPVTGKTSIETYGVRRGTYTDKECKSLVAMTETLKRLVEESCWEQESYDVEVLDSAAALVEPGDTGHFVYKDINKRLRILEIHRETGKGSARLVVGTKADDLADLIVPSARELSTLQKTFQGVPSHTNSNFSEQFERTSGGTDYPANCRFFVPYGADLIDLRLDYEIGGMRSYATGAASGGGSTPTSSSGGGSTPTTSAGGATTPTSSSAPTPSGGGSTSGSTISDIKTFPTVTRGPAGSGTWYDVFLDDTSRDDEYIYIIIYNGDASSQTFYWQVRSAAGGGGSLVASGSTAIASGGFGFGYVGVATLNGWETSDLYARVQMGAGSGNWLFTAVRYGLSSHSHTTPDHTHPTHSHTVTIGDHQHTITINDHTHTVTISPHTHSLVFGIRESSAPGTVRVYLDDVLVTALNDAPVVSGFDLLPYIAKDSNGRVAEGTHILSFRSATNGATGSVRGLLFDRQFIRTEAA